MLWLRLNSPHTAFVIDDAYAGMIVGWDCSTSKVTVFVERAGKFTGHPPDRFAVARAIRSAPSRKP